MATATYTKLKSGEWGIRVESTTIKAGAKIVVEKKDGSSKEKTVSKVIWMGNGVSLCAIHTSAPVAARSTSGGRIYDNRIERNSGGRYCGYPCPVSGQKCCAKNGPCHDCM